MKGGTLLITELQTSSIAAGLGPAGHARLRLRLLTVQAYQSKTGRKGLGFRSRRKSFLQALVEGLANQPSLLLPGRAAEERRPRYLRCFCSQP